MFPAFRLARLEQLDMLHDRFSSGLFSDRALSFPSAEDTGRPFWRDALDLSALTPVRIDAPTTLADKGYDAFAPDGVGSTKDVTLPTLPLLLTLDAQAGDTHTLATLTVDGPHVVSTIDLPGDQDFFRVELVAGQYYNIGEYLKVGGPSLVPLNDAYLELYDSAGNLIVSADGGGPNTPEGLDALLTYQAQYTGTYYVNARAFDNALPDPSTTGDYVGDYEVFVQKVDANDVNIYHPRYSPDQPMHSIDWGTQIDRTSRNPDGDNGPRDNGAPNTGITHNATYDTYGKNVVTYYFAKTGDIFIDEDPTTPGSTDSMVALGMQDWEKDAFRAALHEYEKVADIVYIEVDNRAEADFKFVTYKGTPGAGASLLGRMSPPNTENEGQAEFNAGDVRWTQEGLQQGGFYFPTLLHEFGHGHGMAHPHDNGGHSSVMPGADGGTGGIGGGYGDYQLSQQVFTVMSYNDGWALSPYGGPSSGDLVAMNADTFGWQGTLAALDIAVVQDKYGVNEDYAAGNDVYTLKDVNAPGTYYSCIWDAAGTDEIRYDGSKDANIDLRAATLKYEIGGGGWVSYATGIYGGFTIANGAVIENATGGSGNDTLIGNDAANVLDGSAGTDTMAGGLGDDTYVVDNSGDVVTENAGEGNDTIRTTISMALAANVENLILLAGATDATGNALANKLTGNDAANRIDGGAGADDMSGGKGDDTYIVDNSADIVRENAAEGNDFVYASADYTLSNNVENLILVGSALKGTGNDLANTITGNDGANVLDGKGGADTMIGGNGNDTYYVDQSGDVVTETANAGTDKVISTITTTLGANVENLELAGTANINGTGNALANTIVGNAGNNVIDGGEGADTLTGGAGRDAFVFAAAPTASNRDTITDFRPIDDEIRLDHHVFDTLNVGTLNVQAFYMGAAAHDASDRIIYNPATGALIYDTNGSALGGSIQIATLSTGLTLTAGDFIVV